MNSRLLLSVVLGSLLTLPALAQGVYKWTDESGVTHYSDVPRDGATEVEIAPVQTFSSPEAMRPATGAAAADADADPDDDLDEEQGYQSIAISSPADEETIWNTGGEVQVSVTVRPGIQTGHKLKLYLNGSELGGFPPGSSSVTLTDLPRGTHVVRAEVVDENGRIRIQSEPTTFYYKQQVANNIDRPRPTPRPRPRVFR